MAKILKTKENIVTIPMNVSVTKKGYVYLNRTTIWIEKKNGQGKMADHKKECIGLALHPGNDWSKDRRMYANLNYYKLFLSASSLGKSSIVYDEYPQRSDCISVGLHATVKQVAEESGLLGILTEVFGSEDTCLILDLAMYMISSESAVFQHFPHWAGSHAIFSDTIRSDSYISEFEKESITLSKINSFKRKWALTTLDDGKVFVCYDSTNVNSQTDGVFIVQKGHAKDDPDKNQVNTEYAIRQRDGLPITFNNFPGSVNDMSEAKEMIRFFKNLLAPENEREEDEQGEQRPEMIVIADRGYVSEENIKSLVDAGIGYILLLKKNMGVVDEILDKHIEDVKKAENYIRDSGRFALTVQHKLLRNDTTENWFHIIWDAGLEMRHRAALAKSLELKEQSLLKSIERKIRLTEIDLRTYREYFVIQYHEDGTLQIDDDRKGEKQKKTVPAYVIDSYEKLVKNIESAHKKCGYILYVTDRSLEAVEVMQAISRRDCVEKVFRALKGWLGMNKFGVYLESSMHTKSLIWFVASILRSLIFTKTERVRTKDRKRNTIPAIIDQLEEIRADRDLSTGIYQRRYKTTKIQNNLLNLLGVTIDEIDNIIAELT